MTEFEDPFPNQPTYEEVQEIMPSDGEEANDEDTKYWYNTAPLVAARIFIRVAVEDPEFENVLLEEDMVQSELKEYDEESYQKVEDLELSMFQGMNAISMAKSVYKKEYR